MNHKCNGVCSRCGCKITAYPVSHLEEENKKLRIQVAEMSQVTKTDQPRATLIIDETSEIKS